MATDQRRGTTIVTLPDLPPRDLLRVQRLARELRLTDQILSLDLDTVVVQQGGPAPAWTTLDGDRVSFAFNSMPMPKSALDIAVWLGTNAHELGHVLFSPRRSSVLMFRVIESDRAFLPGIAMLHNIVEDQRQERLLLAKFAPWAGYLTAALGHHLVADDNSAWLLMAGRTWLPAEVRATAKARMIAHRGQRDTDGVTRIVGEYQRLIDPGDTESDVAWELLQELHSMFQDEMPKGRTCTVIVQGEPDVDGGDVIDAWPTADEDADPDDSEPGDGDGDGDGASTADCDGGDGTGGDGDGDDSDSAAPMPDAAAKPGSGIGNQPRQSNQPISQPDVRRALKDAAQEQIEADEDAKSDLDSIVDAIDYGRPGDRADGADPVGVNEEATDAAKMLWRDVTDALLDLKDESEPGWNRRVDSGRLNVRRLISPTIDVDTLFDRYEPGMMDATEMEVVMLLDVSGSMSGSVHQLAEATWAIRHAVDDLEGVCTVLTFDSGPHRVLADPSARPDGRMFVPTASGGTNPKTALREAYWLLSGSQARNRLLIILTDGGWYGGDGDVICEDLNAAGVATVCVLLGSGSMLDLHGCTHGAVIDTPAALARLFRDVAVERIRSQF